MFLYRLAIATFVWFSLTSFFEIVEYKTGLCDMTKSVPEEIRRQTD